MAAHLMGRPWAAHLAAHMLAAHVAAHLALEVPRLHHLALHHLPLGHHLALRHHLALGPTPHGTALARRALPLHGLLRHKALRVEPAWPSGRHHGHGHHRCAELRHRSPHALTLHVALHGAGRHAALHVAHGPHLVEPHRPLLRHPLLLALHAASSALVVGHRTYAASLTRVHLRVHLHPLRRAVARVAHGHHHRPGAGLHHRQATWASRYRHDRLAGAGRLPAARAGGSRRHGPPRWHRRPTAGMAQDLMGGRSRGARPLGRGLHRVTL
mmetsp:Transcript_44296/g.114545  ORF Transcript_44296/g.114545 Transcript_44296/m.114545 type:complete len:270 (-) Transcript_44296:105-914(-)